MEETVIEKMPSRAKDEQWAERIAEQECSRMTVRQFCKEGGFSEYAFYRRRKRLRNRSEPVRFALLETGAGAARREPAMDVEPEREHHRFYPRFIPILGQWPAQASRLGALQVLVNRADPDRAASSDLLVAQFEFESEA